MKKRILIFYILQLLFSASVFAAPATDGSVDGLTLQPPDTDVSFHYLSNIFGTVDGVLAGGIGQLLGTLFGIFNAAVLTLGGIVILYTLFVSTLNTAGQGEMLGKKWSSIWIPLRSVIGITLLIPKASGYSFIQIFMMWVAVMGIGAADSVWNRAVDYFAQQGVLIQSSATTSRALMNPQTNTSAVTQVASTVLRSLTCMELLQTQLENKRIEQSTKGTGSLNPPVPDFYARLLSSAATSADAGTINFPTFTQPDDAFYSNLEGVCGSITWQKPSVQASAFNTQSLSYQNQVEQVNQSRTMAVLAIIQDLRSSARQIADNYQNSNLAIDPLTGKANPNANPPKNLGTIIFPSDGRSGNPPYVWGYGTIQNPLAPLFSSGAMINDAAVHYFNIMSPTLALMNGANANSAAQIALNASKNQGWALAGSYYFTIIDLNQGQTLNETQVPTVTAPANNFSTNARTSAFLDSPYLTALDNVINYNGDTYGVKDENIANKRNFIEDAIVYGKSTNSIPSPVSAPMGAGGVNTSDSTVNTMLNAFAMGGPVAQVNLALVNLLQAEGNMYNPIVLIAQIGDGLTNGIFGAYVGVAIAVLLLCLGSALLPFVGDAIVGAISAMVSVVMSLFSPILLALLVTGLTMSLYLPMIPFIIFLFGVIGWFIAVIEAMIAAPLVALGIAHPEGHEIAGKAEPAIMLLVNVFLRPTFMLFGLLAGMMLSYVGIWLLNQGFDLAFKASHTSVTSVNAGLFKPYAYIIIYVLIVMQIIHKSFALIHLIPDEVLKWIGGNIKGMGGEAEAERTISGGAHAAAEKGGGAVAGSVDAAQKLGDKGAAYIEKQKEKAEAAATGSTATITGGSSGGAGVSSPRGAGGPPGGPPPGSLTGGGGGGPPG